MLTLRQDPCILLIHCVSLSPGAVQGVREREWASHFRVSRLSALHPSQHFLPPLPSRYLYSCPAFPRQHASHPRVVQLFYSSFIGGSFWSRLSPSLPQSSGRRFCLRLHFSLLLFFLRKMFIMFSGTESGVFFHHFCCLVLSACCVENISDLVSQRTFLQDVYWSSFFKRWIDTEILFCCHKL